VSWRKIMPSKAVFGVARWAIWASCALCWGQIEVERLEMRQPDHGLSHGTVYSICQDARGFLWFGTKAGLNLYDGHSFTGYQEHPTLEALGRTVVRDMLPDESGGLWLATSQGVMHFDPVAEAVKLYSPGGLRGMPVGALAMDAFDRLWVGGAFGVGRLPPGEEAVQWTTGEALGVEIGQVHDLFVDVDGSVWAAAAGGLYRFDGEGHAILRFDPPDGASGAARAVFRDGVGELWAGFDSGLARLSASSETLEAFPAEQNGRLLLRGEKVNQIVEDFQGRLWIAFDDGGVARLSPDRIDARFYGPNAQGAALPGNRVLALFFDKTNVAWISVDLHGVAKLDLKPRQFKHFRLHDDGANTSEDVRAIYQDGDRFLWIGGQSGLIRHNLNTGESVHFRHDPDDPASLSDNSILSLCGDTQGRIWVGAYSGGLNRWNPATERFRRYRSRGRPGSLADDMASMLACGADGRVWVGGPGGLQRYEEASDAFVGVALGDANPADDRIWVYAMHHGPSGRYWVGTNRGLFELDSDLQVVRHFDAEPREGLRHRVVTAVLEDARGRVWVGARQGLHLLRDDGGFHYFGQAEGMPNAAVYAIVEGAEGEIWLTANDVAVRVEPPQRVRVFDRSDGLQGLDFNLGAAFKNEEGYIFLGGGNGYNAFYPDGFFSNDKQPDVALTAVKILNREISLKDRLDERGRLRLEDHENFLSFEFAALDFSAPERNRYAYMMKGVDRDWIQAGTRRFASYSNLAGGNYVFHVVGANSDGTWNMNGASLRIFVDTPFWRRWPFMLALSLILAGLAVGIHVGLTRGMAARNERLARKADQQTEALRETNQALMERARKAGFAEIATGVLHNIGNILNSVSISAGSAIGALQRSRLDKFAMVNGLLLKPRDELARFLTQDPKRLLLAPYYERIEEALRKENAFVEREIDLMLDNIELMSRALIIEQNYGSSRGQTARVDLAALADEALKLQEDSFKKRGIHVARRYHAAPPCDTDPTTVVHVLINLLRNAVDALAFEHGEAREKRIEVEVRARDDEHNEICVRDNGVGIDREVRENLFSFGFTTKKNGNGFGLHASRNALRELGGDLAAESGGAGKGAQFRILVPLVARSPQ